MLKIASPRDLQRELTALLNYARTEKPSRARVASVLSALADRVVYDQRLASSDVEIHSVDFAAGQEPDDAIATQEDFVTLVRVDFTVRGPTLARLLEKQDRVIEKALKDLKPQMILNRVQDSQAILRELMPAIKRMVQSYVSSEGARAGKVTVDFASESDLAYSAKADATKKEVRLELEFDVGGTIQ